MNQSSHFRLTRSTLTVLLSFIFMLGAAVSLSAGESKGGVAFHYITTKADWDAAMAKAKKEKKPVFVDAYTSWCPPCKALDRNVFSQDEVGDVLNKDFIAVKVDLEKGYGVDFADKFAIEAFPTLIVLDASGSEKSRWIGFRQAPQLLEELSPFQG